MAYESKKIHSASALTSNEPTESHTGIDVAFSSFTPVQKYDLAYATSISATFSGLSSFIYYPATTALSRCLHTFIEAVNLTITVYLIVAGIVPSVLGDLADRIGRRPISLIALTMYFGANLGLALQDSYTAPDSLEVFVER